MLVFSDGVSFGSFSLVLVVLLFGVLRVLVVLFGAFWCFLVLLVRMSGSLSDCVSGSNARSGKMKRIIEILVRKQYLLVQA